MHISLPLIISTLLSLSHCTSLAKPSCKPSPKVTPKPQYEFTMNLTLGPPSDLGIDIWKARQSYLPVENGTFCAKWNGGVTGTVVSGTTSYYQTSAGVGPYYLSLQYLLRTSDSPPAFILAKQTGWEVNRVGSTTYQFETGDARYASVNTGVYVGVETAYSVVGGRTYSSADGYTLV